jgi:putative oxidoreductase
MRTVAADWAWSAVLAKRAKPLSIVNGRTGYLALESTRMKVSEIVFVGVYSHKFHTSDPWSLILIPDMSRTSRAAYTRLRLVAGFMFVQAGGMKLLGWFGGMPGPAGPTAHVWTQVWFGGVLELFGGIAVMLGLGTRIVAFILSGEMAVAYWQFHAPNGTWPVQNQGVPAVLFCFLYLFMAAAGAGDWSLDALLRRKATPNKM